MQQGDPELAWEKAVKLCWPKTGSPLTLTQSHPTAYDSPFMRPTQRRSKTSRRKQMCIRKERSAKVHKKEENTLER